MKTSLLKCLLSVLLAFALIFLSTGYACNAGSVRKKIKQASSGISSILTAVQSQCSNNNLCDDIRKLQEKLAAFDNSFPTLSSGQALTLLADIVTAFRQVILPLQNISNEIKLYISIVDGALRWLAIEYESQDSKTQRAPLPPGSEGAKKRKVIRDYLDSPKVEKP